MKRKKLLRLQDVKSRRLHLLLLTILTIGNGAYGQNTISISQKEKIEKFEKPIHASKEEGTIGRLGVTGNAVALKGYLGQDTVINNGIIHGQIDVLGKGTLDNPTKEDEKNGSIILDGQGQGISITSFTDVNNKRDAKSSIKKINNNGIIKGIAKIKGGIANKWANIEAWTSGNGVSSNSVIDFGAESGGGGGTDGTGGASVMVVAPKTGEKNKGIVGNKIHIDRITKEDLFGKNVSSVVGNINNNGIIMGKIESTAGVVTGGEYPEFASSRANISGNGISSFSYAFTPDISTFSEKKTNESIIKEIKNSGDILGSSKLKGGQKAAQAYAKGYGDGNGVSSVAFTSNFAKHNTKSSIEKIENSGNIIGNAEFIAGTNRHVSFHEYADVIGKFSGNGLSSYSRNSNYQSKASEASIGNVVNNGTISGNVYAVAGKSRSQAEVQVKGSGNGISVYSEGTRIRKSTLGNVVNNGVISGHSVTQGGMGTDNGTFPNIKTNTEIKASGNGISIQSKDQIGYSYMGDIKNGGVIRGYSSNLVGTQNGRDSEIYSQLSGNGIAVKGKIISNIVNTGVISGSENAIAMSSKSQFNPDKFEGSVKNYGILAGQHIIADNYFSMTGGYQAKDVVPSVENNHGIYITLDKSGNVKKINNGLEGKILEKGIEYRILNADISNNGRDSEILIDTEKEYNHTIINGVGTKTGALNIKGNVVLKNSIVNALDTAVKLQDGGSLTASNTIFNGGGLEGNKLVIAGDEGDNILNLTTSVVNGDINLGKGNDILNLDRSVILNGNINGGVGEDCLNFRKYGNSSNDPTIVKGKINNFKTLNIDTDVVLDENAKVKGTKMINIKDKLTLKINPNIKNLEGKLTGHALYDTNDNELNVKGSGVLNLEAASLNPNAIVSLRNSKITFDKNIKLETNSVIQGARLIKNGDILLTVTELPELLKKNSVLNYKKLNNIYQSYISDWKYTGVNGLKDTISTTYQTEEEATLALSDYFNQVYSNNIYGYAPKLSRDSIKLYENALIDLNGNTEVGQWSLDATGIYSAKQHTRNTDYQGTIDDNASTNTSGVLITGEYGLSDKNSIGISLAGSKQNTDLDGESNLNANSFYLGVQGRHNIGNFGLVNGLGYQKNMYKGNRVIDNGVTRHEFKNDFDTDAVNIFTQLEYQIAFANQWSISPKARLAYSYVSQNDITENGVMGMSIDKENFGVGDALAGIDIQKTLYFDKTKLEMSGTLGYSIAFGDTKKNLTGQFKHGSSFEVESANVSKDTIILGMDIIAETETGIFAQTGANYKIGTDEENELSIKIGAGLRL